MPSHQPYPSFATLAPTAPHSPAALTPTHDRRPSDPPTTLTRQAAAAAVASPTPGGQPDELGFFDPHFELPEHSTGLVEPGAYDDYNPLPALSFPPLPFTLPTDDPLALSIGGPPPPFLASSSSLFFPPPPHAADAAPESLFSFTESSALASFLTSSSDEPLVPPSGGSATLGPAAAHATPAAAASDQQSPFANLVRSRGAWDFNPRLPDFLPVFGREERRSASFGSSTRGDVGGSAERGEEASRRLSGLRISPTPFVAGPASGSPYGAVSVAGGSRVSSFDHLARPSRAPARAQPGFVSRHHSLERPSTIAQRTSHGLSPASAAVPKSRSSSTTVADLLALDRLAASATGARAPRPPSGAVGLGFNMDFLRGPGAMEASAQTSVFDSPGLPSSALPSMVLSDGPHDSSRDVGDGDRDMTAFSNDDGYVREGSGGVSSGSTVVAAPSAARRAGGNDGDQEMSHPSPSPSASASFSSSSPPAPSLPAPPPPPAHSQAPPTVAVTNRRRQSSPHKSEAQPTRASKRVRSSAGSSLRGSSTSVSRSPEIAQGPLPKRRKSSAAPPAAKGKVAASAGPKSVKGEPTLVHMSAGQDDEGEDELDPEDDDDDEREERKGPKPLLTAEQKRTNHILSEQKRRNAIRTGYAELSHLLASSPSAPYPPFDPLAPPPSLPAPRAAAAKSTRGGARGGSKSNMLSRAAGLCRFLEDGNRGLEEECRRVERLVQGSGGA